MSKIADRPHFITIVFALIMAIIAAIGVLIKPKQGESKPPEMGSQPVTPHQSSLPNRERPQFTRLPFDANSTWARQNLPDRQSLPPYHGDVQCVGDARALRFETFNGLDAWFAEISPARNPSLEIVVNKGGVRKIHTLMSLRWPTLDGIPPQVQFVFDTLTESVDLAIGRDIGDFHNNDARPQATIHDSEIRLGSSISVATRQCWNNDAAHLYVQTFDIPVEARSDVLRKIVVVDNHGPDMRGGDGLSKGNSVIFAGVTIEQ